MTGGIGYKFDLTKKEKEWITPRGATPDRLWEEMMEKLSTEHVIGCSNNTKGQVAMSGVAYGVGVHRRL